MQSENTRTVRQAKTELMSMKPDSTFPRQTASPVSSLGNGSVNSMPAHPPGILKQVLGFHHRLSAVRHLTIFPNPYFLKTKAHCVQNVTIP